MIKTSYPGYIEKIAKSFLEYVDHKKFREIIYHLSGSKWMFSQLELNSIISDNYLDTIVIYNVKELLIQQHIITACYNFQQENSTSLSIQYISNITNNQGIELDIQKYLEWRIRTLQKDYAKNSRRININNLRIDFSSYVNNNKNYLFNPVSINKGVILASLYDSLICRMGIANEVIYKYFNDADYGQYFIMTNAGVRSCEEINENVSCIVECMGLVEGSLMQKKNTLSKMPCFDNEEKIANFWGDVYSKLSKDPSTYKIRNYLVNKLNSWPEIRNDLDEKTFKEYLHNIIDDYHVTKLDFNKISDSTVNKIKMIVNYLLCNNCDIYNTINNNLDDNYKFEAQTFILSIYKVYLKKHYSFMERLQDRYNSYLYLFLKAYFKNHLPNNKVYTGSFLKLVRNLNPKDIVF